MATHEYTQNKDLMILWEPAKCQHAAICVKMLPNVYHPKDKPWITPEKATAEELKKQIDNCPTGALSYTAPHSGTSALEK